MTLFHSLQGVLSVYIIILVGYLLTKKGIFDSSTGGQFAWLVVNITFPAYIIAALPEQFSAAEMIGSFYGILAAFVATIVLYPVGYLIAALLKIEEGRRNVFVAMIVFSNVVFIGLPVNMALFGDSSVGFVLQYYIANTFIFWTFGIYFLQSNKANGMKPKVSLKKMINPPLVATLIAIILVMFDMKAPFIIRNTFTMLGNMTTPLATLFIGIVFSEVKFSDCKVTKDMVAVMAGRFLISPAIIFGVIYFTTFPPLLKEVFVIQAAMPVMNQVTISSRYFGADYKYSTIITIWSFIISMFVIPIIVMLFS